MNPESSPPIIPDSICDGLPDWVLSPAAFWASWDVSVGSSIFSTKHSQV